MSWPTKMSQGLHTDTPGAALRNCAVGHTRAADSVMSLATSERAMVDHVGFNVGDFEASLKFYRALESLPPGRRLGLTFRPRCQLRSGPQAGSDA